MSVGMWRKRSRDDGPLLCYGTYRRSVDKIACRSRIEGEEYHNIHAYVQTECDCSDQVADAYVYGIEVSLGGRHSFNCHSCLIQNERTTWAKVMLRLSIMRLAFLPHHLDPVATTPASAKTKSHWPSSDSNLRFLPRHRQKGKHPSSLCEYRSKRNPPLMQSIGGRKQEEEEA